MRQRPTQIRLIALRYCIEDCIQKLHWRKPKEALSHAIDAHTRICALLPTTEEMAEKRRKAKIAGKLGGTTKARNALKSRLRNLR